MFTQSILNDRTIDLEVRRVSTVMDITQLRTNALTDVHEMWNNSTLRSRSSQQLFRVEFVLYRRTRSNALAQPHLFSYLSVFLFLPLTAETLFVVFLI